MKKLVSILATVLASHSMFAQQNVQFTHYMYNVLSVNPAYAGSHDALNLTGLYRTQWVGLEGAPKTFSFYAHAPVYKKIGAGISFLNDRIGPVNFSQIIGDLSYNINVSEKGKLYFGTKLGLNLYSANTASLFTIDPNDPGLVNNAQNKTHLNVGAGIYYTNQKHFIGFSAPNLTNDKLDLLNASHNAAFNHFYLMGGSIFTLSPSLKLKPTAGLKFTKNAPLSLDLSAQFLIIEKLWLGGAYRFGDALSALVGYQFNEQLKAGYSYDFTTSELNNVNSGSHEFFISYDLHFTHKKIVSPRYL